MEPTPSQPSAPVQPVATPPVVPPATPPSHSKLPWILLVVVLLVAMGAGGVFLGKQMSTPAVVIPTPAPVAVLPTPTSDPVANWKTYTNSENNFEFKYPTDLQPTETKIGSFIPSYYLSQFIVGFSKEVFSNDKAQFTEDAMCTVSADSSIKDCYTVDTKPADTQQTINGVTFYMASLGGAATGHSIGGKAYRTIRGNSCYEIAITQQTSTGSGEGLAELQPEITANSNSIMATFDQILSTFKFTTSNSTSNWRTFTDPNNKYSIQYPDGLELYNQQPTQNNPTSLVKLTLIGPTQKASGKTQTSISDGYQVSISDSGVAQTIDLAADANKARSAILDSMTETACQVSPVTSGIIDAVPTAEYSFTNCLGNGRAVLTYYNSQAYEISENYSSDVYKPAADQVLSTFKVVK